MNKTVTYKGQKVKVYFDSEVVTRDIYKKDNQGRILHMTAKRKFYINDKTYIIGIESKRDSNKRTGSFLMSFEDYKQTNDNEKQMIEHIISIYGI